MEDSDGKSALGNVRAAVGQCDGKERVMKSKITEIEASAEELRQSNSLADGLTRLLRNAFNPYSFPLTTDEEEQTESEGE